MDNQMMDTDATLSRSLVKKEQESGRFQHFFNTSLSQTGRQIQDSNQNQIRQDNWAGHFQRQPSSRGKKDEQV